LPILQAALSHRGWTAHNEDRAVADQQTGAKFLVRDCGVCDSCHNGLKRPCHMSLREWRPQMSLPSESSGFRRHSLAWAMVVIAVFAANFAAVRPMLPIGLSPLMLDALRASHPIDFPNIGLGVMILVLEVGLFRLISNQGVNRAFWLGFEIAGWAYVIVCMVFAGAAWGLARSLFEKYVLGGQMSFRSGLGQFVQFACGLHLAIALAVALFAGVIARTAWRRWSPPNQRHPAADMA
jgi:hypothetical protein